MKKLAYLTAIAIMSVVINSAFAYTVPEDDSRAKYFYVFGPDGNTDLGAETPEQALYIDVPVDTYSEVFIAIYDPDTGKSLDDRTDSLNPWDTVTEFTVYGKDNTLLEKQEFQESKEYNRRYYRFGPYQKEQGEAIGNYYRFKLITKALKGDDQNLYNVKISPEDSAAFTYKLLIRLLEPREEKMYFYPEIPAQTETIIVENYDMDKDGGTSRLYDPQLRTPYKIQDSGSSLWAKTVIPINAKEAKRLEYVITKKTQRHANAGLKIEDDKGNPIPIYFAQGKVRVAAIPRKIEVISAPLIKCNDTHTFDARDSYDPGDGTLSYLWDFGDCTTSDQPLVTHTFEKSGEYTVKLTVRNDSGLECNTSEAVTTIRVNTPPLASFTAPEAACISQEITFDASATQDDDTSDDLSYLWDFGDGTTAQGKQVTKAYQKNGTYKVTLTVDDNAETTCSISRASKIIKVNAHPVVAKPKDIDICVAPNEEYRVNFDFMRSKETAERNLTYKWDFGDGSTGEGRAVTHVYQKKGTYTAAFTADDGLGLPCSSTSSTFTVKLNRPPVAEAGDNINSCADTGINFDGSRSSVEDEETLTYKWDFGDGEIGQGARVTHAYRKSGTYKARLTVDDGKGTRCSTSEDTLMVGINSRPSAAIKNVDSECVGREVEFDASRSSDSDGDTLTYTWDFGDGATSENKPKTSHAYQKGGKYLVKVTVDDGSQTPCSSDTKISNIRINTPPIANAGQNLVCCVNATSTFDGSSSSDAEGDTLSYTWDFGDGATAKGANVTHRYTKAGTYIVILTVKDDSNTQCNTSVSSFTAKVNEKPVSIIKVR